MFSSFYYLMVFKSFIYYYEIISKNKWLSKVIIKVYSVFIFMEVLEGLFMGFICRLY